LKESGNATLADKFDSWRASSRLPPELKYRSAFLCLYLFLATQPYLHIGGGKDSLNFPAPDDAESLQWQLSLTGRETYNRSTLSLGDASITIYVHEGLTPEQVLNRLVEHYKAWAVNRPGGRR
jgi:hypothetical protein